MNDADIEALVAQLDGLAEAYPEDVFPPISPEEAIEVRATRPGLIDRASGAMGRHLGKFFKQSASALTSLKAERDRLQDENKELRAAPWPKWATDVLVVIRARSGYDGYDDADGVDLPAELEELMSELEQQAERNLAEARAAREVEQHKASTDHYRLKASEHRRERDEARAEVERLRKALEPFARAARAMPKDDPGPFPLYSLTGYRQITRSDLNGALSALHPEGGEHGR